MIDVDPATGSVRLDDEGLAQLLDAATGRLDDEAVAARLAEAGLRLALDTLGDPAVTLDLVVAGSSLRLQHRVWVDLDRAVVVLGVRPDLHQVLVLPPAHLAAGLVRMTRMRPRRTGERRERPWPADRLDALVDADPDVRVPALEEAGASVAWRLGVSGGEDRHEVTAVDGEDGLHLADPADEVLRPVSNTTAYRIFSTALLSTALLSTALPAAAG